jgi:hypothetical protein
VQVRCAAAKRAYAWGVVERREPGDEGARERDGADEWVDELAETREVEVPDLGAIERALRATSFTPAASAVIRIEGT